MKRIRSWPAWPVSSAWFVGALLASGCGEASLDSNSDGGVLAPAGAATVSGAVDGITCDTSEQLLFHIHAHLAIYVNGSLRLVPAGIGIGPPLATTNGFVVGGSCYSWLHTHDTSGVIHIESPVQRVFTLGNLFHVWGVPLSADTVGPASGKVSAWLNGAAYTGDVTALPMDAHNVIQLNLGSPDVPFQPYTFSANL